METIREAPQTSEIVQSENTCVEKPQKLSSDANINDNQLDHLNGTSSNEFPEPEKMLLAPPGNDNMSNDLGQLTSEKGAAGSEESVDRIKSLSRKKRHLTESISGPQNGSSAKLPGRPRGRRITEHIPEDDDLLASILGNTIFLDLEINTFNGNDFANFILKVKRFQYVLPCT